jgi:hypothetical protein
MACTNSFQDEKQIATRRPRDHYSSGLLKRPHGSLFLVLLLLSTIETSYSLIQPHHGRRGHDSLRFSAIPKAIELEHSATNEQLQQQKQQQQQAQKERANEKIENGGNDDDATIQWQLLLKYHAKNTNKGYDDGNGLQRCVTSITSWKGIWKTYDYMGDVQFETVASVDYDTTTFVDNGGNNADAAETGSTDPINSTTKNIATNNNNNNNVRIQQNHRIVVGATRSDCTTCFDSMETRSIPVATLIEPKDLVKKRIRLGGCGMVTGPTLLRNGISTLFCVFFW